MKWLVVTVLCLLGGAAHGQITRTGTCTTQTVALLNFAELVGTWHEIYRLAEETADTYDCSQIEITAPVGGGAVVPASVLPFADQRVTLTNRAVQNVTGTIQIDIVAGAGNQVGAIRVTVGTAPFRVYRILNPSIANFLVAYSCEQITETTITERALILVRGARGLTAEQYTNLKVFLSTTTLEVPRLRATEQDSYICQTSNACSRIQAPLMSNFDVTAFHGDWFELSRQENDLQRDEDCVINAYSPVLNQATQTHFNKTMINLNSRQITSFTGNGVITQTTPNPQLGVMTVTFMQDQTERRFEYRILNTDYTTYAVVYSCVNTAGVVTYPNLWVLARNRALENRTEIDRVIANSTVHSLVLRPTQQDEDICSSSTILTASIMTVLLTAILVQFRA